MVDETEFGGRPAAAFVTFAALNRVAAGTLAEAAAGAKHALEVDDSAVVLVFNTITGEVADLDLRGTAIEVAARYTQLAASAPKRGRPKLGVVAREVTLLPRHWEWLSKQPGGASVALRKLVEAARKLDTESGSAQARIEAAYRFMSAIAGDLPGFEDAARSLFAGDWSGLRRRIRDWPPDVQDQLLCQFLATGDDASDCSSRDRQ